MLAFPRLTTYWIDELDLGQVFVLGDIDQSWINWREVFLSIMDLCIPHATLPTRKSLPWLTKTLVNAMKKRNYYFRKSMRSGDLHAFAKYKTLRNYIVTFVRPNKPFLQIYNPPTSIFTNAEKANCLNKYFSNCFNTALPQLSQSEFLYLDPDKCPSNLLCNDSEVYNLLVGVDVTKSTGPDNISGRMIKSTACSITPAVTALFNQAIRQGKLPNDWKTAHITPVPKASDCTKVENYRPISILLILSKLLERHIYNFLMKHLNDHPLSDNQWGFIRGKSTVGALLTAVDSWHQQLDQYLCSIF